MSLKHTARTILEKIVVKFGYSLTRTVGDDALFATVLGQKEVPFSQEQADKLREEFGDTVVLNWIMPMIAPGSGGHTTLFRNISTLEKLGIHSRVYISDLYFEFDSIKLRETAAQFYGFDVSKVEFYDTPSKMVACDAVVATSWQTAYVADKFNNCKKKFYFVQDFEPFFYPVGTSFTLAENTYKLGFTGITAGHWLDKKLADEYGMKTHGFGFACDRSIYQPGDDVEETKLKKKVFFYARPNTERRAFSVGVIALTLFHRLQPDVEIIMAGQSIGNQGFEFPFVDRGVVTQRELAEIYKECDMCLVMSMTNLSLLPLEIMSSGSVCVINDGPNNDWLVNDSNSVIVDTVPENIAKAMNYFISHPEELKNKRLEGMKAADAYNWDTEIEGVASFIKEEMA